MRRMLMPISLAIAALLSGVWLLVIGVRGRRVGDHPHCRRCGFDLFGLPNTSSRCPECGANLTVRRSTVTGARRSRSFSLGIGLLLALLSITFATIAAIARL